MRVFAISDLHIDFRENFDAFQDFLERQDFSRDALILAGDISDDLAKVRSALGRARDLFAAVLYTPGNHDLWVRRENFTNSIEKFSGILNLCRNLDVKTRPLKLGIDDPAPVWIVPLFSWYIMPEEGDGGLYIEFPDDPGIDSWSDNYFIRWPGFGRLATAAQYFLNLNLGALTQSYDAPVISFSHFLPRQELMRPERMPDSEELARMRAALGRRRQFNFSRVAGCKGLETQVRMLHPYLHIYGHQHRNRRRELDGLTYLSNCLGYPVERQRAALTIPEGGFYEVWDTSRRSD